MKHVIIIGFVAVGLVGCPVLHSKLDTPAVESEAPPAESEPQSPELTAAIHELILPSVYAIPGVPSQNPRNYRWLCHLDAGRHCHGCDDPAGCPQEDAGPLCCVGDTCVVWSGSHCSGVLGWCFNYSKQTDPASGVDQAVCHDE